MEAQKKFWFFPALVIVICAGYVIASTGSDPSEEKLPPIKQKKNSKQSIPEDYSSQEYQREEVMVESAKPIQASQPGSPMYEQPETLTSNLFQPQSDFSPADSPMYAASAGMGYSAAAEIPSAQADQRQKIFPVTAMNTPDEVKERIMEDILDGPTPYPYGNTHPSQLKPETEKTKKKSSKAQRNSSSEKASQGESRRQISATSGSRYSRYVRDEPELTNQASKGSQEEGDDEEESTAEPDFEVREYDAMAANPVPDWLSEIYKFVYVDSFEKGPGGSSHFENFSYARNRNDSAFRSVIFSPPDWKLDWEVQPQDLMMAINRHLLPLGVGGRITIGVKEGFYVPDGAGSDFMIAENPFCSKTEDDKPVLLRDGKSVLEQPTNVTCSVEPALVEVAGADRTFYPFPCDVSSVQGARFCAGIVPSVYEPGMNLRRSGGDHFDLSQIEGLPKDFRLRYIRLTDLGNDIGANGAKGFDLNSVVIFDLKKE